MRGAATRSTRNGDDDLDWLEDDEEFESPAAAGIAQHEAEGARLQRQLAEARAQQALFNPSLATEAAEAERDRVHNASVVSYGIAPG